MAADLRRGLRRLEWLLAALGCVCLAWYGLVTFRAKQYQRLQSAQLEHAISEQPTTVPERPTIERPSANTVKPDHQLIGRLEIPRVRLSVMVVDGDDDGTLDIAAGHLPDTPLPWEVGNSAVAGHRDTFFRPLAGIRVNDRVVLTTPHGDFQYAVTSTRIVDPNDLSVLAQNGKSALTLVTCYPFSYVGHAPKRFVVRADAVPS